MSLVQIFARNLKAVRTSKGLTHAQVAHRAKVSTSYLSMLEHATRTPALETIEALARALGVKPLSLLDGAPARRTTRAAPSSRRRAA